MQQNPANEFRLKLLSELSNHKELTEAQKTMMIELVESLNTKTAKSGWSIRGASSSFFCTAMF